MTPAPPCVKSGTPRDTPRRFAQTGRWKPSSMTGWRPPRWSGSSRLSARCEAITDGLARSLSCRGVPWKEIAGTRDHLSHGYDDVDYQVLWDAVNQDVPVLLSTIEQVLKELVGWYAPVVWPGTTASGHRAGCRARACVSSQRMQNECTVRHQAGRMTRGCFGLAADPGRGGWSRRCRRRRQEALPSPGASVQSGSAPNRPVVSGKPGMGTGGPGGEGRSVVPAKSANHAKGLTNRCRPRAPTRRAPCFRPRTPAALRTSTFALRTSSSPHGAAVSESLSFRVVAEAG